MASEKAKQLAAQIKADRKAERLRKRNSDDPRDWNQARQVREAWKLTRQYDKQLDLLMGAAFAIPVVVLLVVGLVWPPVWLSLVTGIALGVLAAMFVLVRRADKAKYKRFEGMPGAGEVALSSLGKGWVSAPAIAATRYKDVVHRTVGRAGIVLVGEGDPGRVKQLLAQEAKRHEQVAYGVKVTLVAMGDHAGEVPLASLASHIKKLPKTTTPGQVTDIQARLKALDAVRPKVPLPKGPLPTRISRAGLRGR